MNHNLLGILKTFKASMDRRGLPAVLVNSIPKSGTNLLMNVFASVPHMTVCADVSLASQRHEATERLAYIRGIIKEVRRGCIYTGHIPYSEEIDLWIREEGLRHIFLYRDPRDVTVSAYHYIMKDVMPRHAYYEMYSKFGSDQERLLKCITGFGEGELEYRNSAETIPSIRLSYEVYEPWLTASEVLAIKYEDLVGAARMKSMEALLRFSGIPCTPDLLNKINAEGFNPAKSHTYRKGGSGGWRDEYMPEHIQAFKRIFNDELLASWGYKWDGQSE